MTWSSPIFFYGLLGLIIPLIIHLWSKNTKTELYFGSIQFLLESETRTMRSLLPSEWLLLLLRSLLVTLFVLIMVSLSYRKTGEFTDRIYLIDPRYADHESLPSILDTIPIDNTRAFADGFLHWEKYNGRVRNDDNWRIIGKLGELKADEVVIISPLSITDFTGVSREIPEHVKWITLPERGKSFPFAKVQTQSGPMELIANSDEFGMSFDWIQTTDADTILEVDLFLFADPEFHELEKILSATFGALNGTGIVSYRVIPDSINADWIAWLSERPPPSRLNLITLGDPGESKVLNSPFPHFATIKPDLTAEEAITNNFPLELERLIAPSVDLTSLDKRSLPLDQLELTSEEYQNQTEELTSLNVVLWVLLIGIMISERTISYTRKQR